MATVIRERDRGAEALRRRMKEQASVKVGIVGQKAGAATPAHGGLTNVEVASFHEFGLGVPKRPFITQPVDQNEEQLKAKLRRIAKNVAKGQSLEQALAQFGRDLVGMMQDAISNREYQENAQATKDRKNSSTPLVNIGQLRSAIDSEVDTGKRRA